VAKITIDSKEYEFDAGMNLFEACTIARGEPLPHFCYHPGLSVVGVCRMCQVEIEGSPKLQIACNSTVRDGMVVHTRSDRVNAAVRQILNFHLLHHPVDCPVCDQAGECSLQDFYMKNGLYEAAIDIDDKIAKDKVKPIGELVILDAERCVLCARCTRFTAEITKTHEMGIFNRGDHSEIDVAPGMTLDNNYSLNTVDICPVGALTSRDFRFKRRVWWLSETDSICDGCATGCNMRIHHSEGIAYRTKPRVNLGVNDYWMCDMGRLLYHRIRRDRLDQPRLRGAPGETPRPAGWDAAYRVVEATLKRFESTGRLVVVGSPHATVEELYALQSVFGEAIGGQLLGYRLAGSEMDEDDGLLLAADRTPNAAGARRLGLEEFSVEALQAAGGSDAVLLVLGNDLAGLSVDAAAALTSFALTIYVGAHEDATSKLADVTLASLEHAEKEGIFVNRDGRAQVFHKAFDGPGQTRDPLRILAELAALMGSTPSWREAGDVRSELVARREAFAALSGGMDPGGILLDAPAEASSRDVSEVERG
jgi:NADH-quinone oxidoreductase subunit G